MIQPIQGLRAIRLFQIFSSFFLDYLPNAKRKGDGGEEKKKGRVHPVTIPALK